METREVTKRGVTVKYGIENDHVVIFDPATGKETARLPLKRRPPGNLQPPENLGKGQLEGWTDFDSCMKGCYDPAQGDPWALAACIALCSTIIFT